MESVTDSTSQPSTPTLAPRSRRVCGILSPPPMDYNVDTPPESPQEGTFRPISPARTPPPAPPPRSPLRPSPKSISSFTTLIDSYSKRDTVLTQNLTNRDTTFTEHYSKRSTALVEGFTQRDTATSTTTRQSHPDSMPNRSRSVGSLSALSALLDMYALSSPTSPSPQSPDSIGTIPDEYSPLDRRRDEKPLPSIPPKEHDELPEADIDDDDASSLGSLTATNQSIDTSETSTISTLPTAIPRVSKRIHALNELLSSERAYASDLAFIRDVHIPLALGKLQARRLLSICF